jgi:hypothetical protein
VRGQKSENRSQKRELKGQSKKEMGLNNIKYCGNCNPDIHPKYIRHIVERMAARTGPETLVCVNGCSRECLTKSKDVYPGRTIMLLNAGALIMKNEEPDGEGQ